MNTPTPETDELERSMREQYEVVRECGWPPFDICDITDFARKIERERDEARAERDQLRKVCDELANATRAEFGELNWRLDAYNNLPHVKL